ncbi:MAG: histidine phosphatase family protein [Candidatus Thorarchaeota archaeon]|jgi:broad specificity phosphatase PhoE
MPSDIIFLRHAETTIKYDLPPSKWPLSDRGKRAAAKLAISDLLDDATSVFSSTEPKAYQTAMIFAIKLKRAVVYEPALNELNRDGGMLMTSEGYRKAVHSVLMDPNHKEFGWETSSSALSRFRSGIERLQSVHKDETILVVSHGIVLTLYFSYLFQDEERCLDRWNALEYCCWGRVTDGKVVKDLGDF